jgi:hypothetical protein
MFLDLRYDFMKSSWTQGVPDYIFLTYVGNIKRRCALLEGFRRGVKETFALLRSYAAFIGSYLPTFLGDRSFPSLRIR